MKPTLRIEVPSTQGDALPLRSLIATSVACLALGLAVARSLAGSEEQHAAIVAPHEEAAPSADAGAEEAAAIAEAAPEPAAAPSPPPPVEPAPVEPQTIATIAPDAAAAAEATSTPEATATPEAAPPPETAAVPEPAAPVETKAPEAAAAPEPAVEAAAIADPRHLRIEAGVFAYLRCEGLPKKRGKYPCPRDRALERRMREIIETLPSCRDAGAIPRGRSFELRIELGEGGTFKELDVTGPNEAAEKAVRACAGPALRKERTALEPKRMIVSMRFKAR